MPPHDDRRFPGDGEPCADAERDEDGDEDGARAL
jgi:hypothetical protein